MITFLGIKKKGLYFYNPFNFIIFYITNLNVTRWD